MEKLLEELQGEKNRLSQLRSEILAEIQDINDQIKEYEETGLTHLREVEDPSWAIRIRDARKHKLRTLREYEIELDNIKFEMKKITRAVDTNLAAVFFKVAEQRLPEDLFAQLLAECQG